jgi:hypothetical protein
MDFNFTDSFYGNEENDYASPGRRKFPYIFGQSSAPTPTPDPEVANYYNQYQSLGGQFPGYSRVEDYYNQDDAARLREMTTRDSGASRILEDYYSQMPSREGYSPGVGRRIAGFLLGTLGRSGYAGARNYIDEPYNDAVEEWKMQGPGVAQRARNAEAAQNRELAGFKVEAGARAGQARLHSQDSRRGDTTASGLVRGANTTNQNQQRIDATNAQNEINNKLKKESEDRKAESTDLRNQLTQARISNLENRKAPLPSLAQAKTAASKDIMAEYPELFDEETGGFKADIDPLKRQQIMRYRDSLTKLYMEGKTPTNLGEEGGF